MRQIIAKQICSLWVLIYLTTSGLLTTAFAAVNIQIDDNETVKLPCEITASGEYVMSLWILPDLTVLSAGQSNEYYTVNFDGSLTLLYPALHDSGRYYCLATRRTLMDKQKASLVILRVGSSIPDEISWEILRCNLISAGISAGVVILAMVGMLIVYRYRWRKEKSPITVPPHIDSVSSVYGEMCEKEKEKF